MAEIIREIGAIARALDSISNIEFKEVALTRGQYLYLVRICENPGIIQEKIAEMLKVDRTTTARALKKLESNGLIRRVTDEQNKKNKRCYPTAQGEALYPMIIREHHHSTKVALAGLSEEEIQQLERLLTHVRKNISEDWNFVKRAINACIERDVGVGKVEIRPIVGSEVERLQAISIETYTDTFGEYNTQADMDAYLSQAYDLQRLTKELIQPDSAFFWALDHGEIAGYLKLNIGKAQSEEMPEDHLEIERIYIRPPYKKKGIGTHLMNWALAQAKAKGKTAVWLGVWEHNDPAQAFYRKHGFIHQGQHVFYMGDDAQIDHILVKKINEV